MTTLDACRVHRAVSSLDVASWLISGADDRRASPSQPGVTLARLDNSDEAVAAYDQALTLYKELLQRNLREAESWLRKGFVLEALKRRAEALAAYEMALRLDPTNVAAWAAKDDCLLQPEQYGEALETCDQCQFLSIG
ncbi:tetratricopeptide repeat protein [Thermogemmatispora sp.]|uniref:tetratricopeptide repeat protein n=1 Tax=Thermogemmatispora sp. TaxID=1968838 RepID=UPI001DA925F8|nr:tetratricopeptide repeat protein [Thermogemmatispora sp.]MBX5451022.1 tetratricopeptide repeat protein [Thermogemmatispora sp.]